MLVKMQVGSVRLDCKCDGEYRLVSFSNTTKSNHNVCVGFLKLNKASIAMCALAASISLSSILL